MIEKYDYQNQIIEIDENPEHLAKQKIRDEVYAAAGDPESIVGTVSDAAIVSIDNLVVDVLAVDDSSDSTYKTSRIKHYDDIHGEGAWDDAVLMAKDWKQKRVNKEIISTVDVKGASKVFLDVGVRTTAVANVLSENEKAS